MSANIVIFSRFRLCETKANSLKKTLKRAKSGKQKAAAYAQKRELRFSFCDNKYILIKKEYYYLLSCWLYAAEADYMPKMYRVKVILR